MVQEKNDGINKDMVLPPVQQNRPALSWALKIKKKLKTVPPCLGKFRPTVGQCCHQCTPDSLRKKPGQNSFLGFHNLLSVNETHTRYRGWLVRRVCCVLFVSGRKVYASPVSNRLERVCQSNRVKKALTAEHKAPEEGDSRGQLSHLSPFLPLINTCISPGLIRFLGWVMLKMFSSMFGSIQVNLSHLPALHRASQEGSLLVYVHLRQSVVDCALISLMLFCHNLRVPYALCPLRINSSIIRSILQKVGVVLLPPSALTEQEAEMDSLYVPVMASLVRELLHEGQAISVGVSAESGQGGQWLARIRQLIKEGSVPDVFLVPVGISYDCVPMTSAQVGLSSVLQWLLSLLWRRPEGSVRIDFAQPFSLKEMCESGRCRVDEWLPLQDLLLPVILNNRTDSVFGQKRMSWLLPSSHYASELKEPSHPDRDLSIAIILHLIFSATSCTAVMSTSLVSSLLLYRHRKGVSVSALCRDVAWLTEEFLFRNRDVGFGGSLEDVFRYSLSLLAPHLIIAAAPSRKDPFIAPRPSLASMLHLTQQTKIVTHTFILEAVGACAVSAMLCEVVSSGVSSRVRSGDVDGEQVSGDMEFDVVLCQSELTERALQLCHLLPPGFMPPCQSSQNFALDAVDSLVRCGILIMEEIPRDIPICDFWKREGTLTWTTSDDPYHSDSDCDMEEQDLRSYKISQPSQCPEMLFFLCSMLAGHLRALCWTTTALDLVNTPLPEAEFVAQVHSHLCDMANKKKQHYESCSEEAAHTAVRSLIDLGVLSEERREGGVFLGVVPLFQLSENRQKLHRFISQYLYN
ncbi:glycerol-3-phosphate acyltransferase 2, mitochondrial isoform X2 [Epinephelus fuscoguttatus]|uniref:glycerol-3-phosphate acyltransferase 2, mitochondrial isoform X2 n=1 Tax=Epinephelus fuscoguttatus TaxID=293821 RepID=UPI0020D15774|nr:glycerol-3-phosphate acyltransferase 2, mitochondrial isoform X2 [Epinephelus fuscoguttatus]XP_049434270.1 glycerol-3-phosphate acyltransferase 2, mitochondrial isoform X2 [Epinephelus fuscoguttatus]XP_049434271.1 glycerol-3-phosphate acyltransferase 2, mitochondrial isoform X2 [Epinephelus fuscoguttatus]XP_049434272.1 glycerol-3-phosphate acyltransferase 2, mitochondrial isoform X2 [Epinephelus fuscoguttatus]XP_049434273.1 glycerol-3-phosphate acyltransferase 2, mitochondrial isoform X2 [Ep